MKKMSSYLVFGTLLEIAGSLLVVSQNWKIGVGLFLIVWGNNIVGAVSRSKK